MVTISFKQFELAADRADNMRYHDLDFTFDYDQDETLFVLK